MRDTSLITLARPARPRCLPPAQARKLLLRLPGLDELDADQARELIDELATTVCQQITITGDAGIPRVRQLLDPLVCSAVTGRAPPAGAPTGPGREGARSRSRGPGRAQSAAHSLGSTGTAALGAARCAASA
jgi:hypothetical protein